jgi:O-antigen/teichoic acid export membrane protein
MSNPLSTNYKKIRKFLPKSIENWLQRLRSSQIGQRLISGFLWSLTGSMITRILGLASSVIIARLLGKEGFGELGLINSTLGMLGPLAGCMLGYTCTKNIAEHRYRNPEKAANILALTGFIAWITGGVVAGGLFFLAPWIASRVIAAPHLGEVLKISSLMIFFGALNGVQTGALAGFEAFKEIARVNLIVGLVTFPMVIIGAYINGLNGLIWGLTGSNLINWLLNHKALRHIAAQSEIPFRLKGCLNEWNILWKFSFPSMLTSMFSGLAVWGCHALLVNQPNGYGKMGLLNAANQWRAPILFLCNSLGNIVLPVLSSLNTLADRDKYYKILKANIKINGLLALLISISFAFLSPWILQMYGEGFVEGVLVFVVIVLITPVEAISGVLGLAMVSTGKLWNTAGFNLIWAGLAYVLSMNLIPSYGALGLAIAFGTSWIALMALQAIFVSTKRISDPQTSIG